MIVTKKEISIYVRAILCIISCCLYTQGRFQQNLCNNFLFQIITKGCRNDRRGLVPSSFLVPLSCLLCTPVEKSYKKKDRKQVKKKSIEKIEDVSRKGH